MSRYAVYVNTEALRRERYSKKLSLADMALKLGKKSASSYSNLETGVIEPKISDIIKVSDILEQPIEVFFNLKVQETCTI